MSNEGLRPFGRGRGRARPLNADLERPPPPGVFSNRGGRLGSADVIDGHVFPRNDALRIPGIDLQAPSGIEIPTRKAVKEVAPVPDRLICDTAVNVIVVGVDMGEKHLLIRFEDDLTKRCREKFVNDMNEFYKSRSANQLRIPFECLQEGEVVIMSDISGDFHRVKVPERNALDVESVVDIDTYRKFTMDKSSIYQMTSEMCQLWFQVVKCEVSVLKDSRSEKWLKDNAFIFEKTSLLERCVLSTLELRLNDVLITSGVKRSHKEGVLSITVDIFGNEESAADFMTSLGFFTIPRLPAVGQSKFGVLTNIMKTGEIDVVFVDFWIKIVEVIKRIQESEFFLPPSHFRFLKELWKSFHIKQFLAPLPGCGPSVLHRVEILNEPLDQELDVEVRYLDIGRKLKIPLENLLVPLRKTCVPQLLETIRPQSVRVRLNEYHQLDDKAYLKELKPLLEGRPCCVRTVNDKDEKLPPVVEVWSEIHNEVVSIIDFIHEKRSTTFKKTGEPTLTKPYVQALQNIAEKLAAQNWKLNTGMQDNVTKTISPRE